MEFNFSVNGDKLRLSGKNDAVSGNSNTYNCNFDFSNDYNDMVCFAIFTASDENFTVEIRDNKCLVPYEVLENGEYFQVGIFATKEDEGEFKRLSTNSVGINVVTGAYTVFSVPGTPDLWERYLFDVIRERELAKKEKEGAMAAAKTAAEEAARISAKEAADRVTENIDENIRCEVLNQRAEIVEEVLLALPDGDEVSY